MSPTTARAISTAVLGGVAAVLFLTQGLLAWAGFIGWAGFLAAGGDGPAFRKSAAGYIFGAFMAYVALILMTVIAVNPDTSMWMPRAVGAIGLTLFVLVLATQLELLSNLAVNLLGFATVVGAFTVPMYGLRGWARLTGVSLSNPFIQGPISLIGGALVGFLAVRLAGKLAKADA